jgi:hypothetical protein
MPNSVITLLRITYFTHLESSPLSLGLGRGRERPPICSQCQNLTNPYFSTPQRRERLGGNQALAANSFLLAAEPNLPQSGQL